MPAFMKGKFYGVVTVGERGQVVIPAELRADLSIKAGDKLVACGALGGNGVVLIKVEKVAKHIDEAIEHLMEAKEVVKSPKITGKTSKKKEKP